jgi:hypothetical protein
VNVPGFSKCRITLAVLLGVGILTVLAVKPVVSPSGMWESCFGTLEEIDIAKQYWALENDKPRGSEVTPADLQPRYLRDMPRCAKGGTYVLGKIGDHPTCSIRNNPWHQRHYFLNYAREEFVTGKRVRFIGYATNSATGPLVQFGSRSYAVDSPHRWGLLSRNRKVTVFGALSAGPPYTITNATFERGYFPCSSYAACIATAKQLQGAKDTWALEKQKPGDASVKMSDLREMEYFRHLPRCDSGGIYIIGKVDDAPTCTLHGDVLKY